jgi:hypothetical protein
LPGVVEGRKEDRKRLIEREREREMLACLKDGLVHILRAGLPVQGDLMYDVST